MDIVRQLKREFSSMGGTMLWGQLRAMGFMITRSRVRWVLREVDLIHTALRWRGELTRRQPYSVPGPKCLWHIGMMSIKHVYMANVCHWLTVYVDSVLSDSVVCIME